MRNIPPVHLLAAFDAVARHQSFNQAAEDLHLSHSAVSHRIRELERLVGATLFHRSTRAVALSPQGTWLHQQIRAPLEALEAAFGRFTHERDVVRISALPSFARLRLVPALTAFHHSHPAVSVAIDPTTRNVQLEQGEADIAIRFAHQAPQAFHCEHLLDDEWFAVAAPRYLEPFDGLGLAALFGRASLLSHSRQPWDPWLQAAGLRIPATRRQLSYTDTGLMLDAALNLQGIALGRRSLVQRLLAEGSLVRVSDIAIPCEQRYFLLASERAMLSRHGPMVMDWIRALAAQPP
ncbi:Gcv operon activator [Delftia tsuruhatensis]|uniref:LysR substrate-binding domain-containing protein n=1 Tax=Delftia tsuruhatensis TaxID=180282 RepID=UPI001E7794F0|nr:LysR substrate-binding domain-containing protein [Delftia tsuruhatensis]CAB5721923.1 Gcv operon activator [Delftia tsuruhatensis]CAC9681869.1 Gcv operon activator [Delftia tsuruhatensis]